MLTLAKAFAAAAAPNDVIRVSVEESAAVVEKNPGSGLPISILPAEKQRLAREGRNVRLKDLMNGKPPAKRRAK